MGSGKVVRNDEMTGCSVGYLILVLFYPVLNITFLEPMKFVEDEELGYVLWFSLTTPENVVLGHSCSF